MRSGRDSIMLEDVANRSGKVITESGSCMWGRQILSGERNAGGFDFLNYEKKIELPLLTMAFHHLLQVSGYELEQ